MTFVLTFVFSLNDDPTIWAVLGAGAGIYLFYLGFRTLQRKRLILNTPTSKIRSASIGLVEVNGLAVGPYTMIAPITAVPCYYYRTVAWQRRQRGKHQEWEKVADESLHLPFYLDDNSGRLLVDPQGAEMDIHRDFHDEFSDSFFSSSLGVPVNVSSFLARHGVSDDKKTKVEEYCIKPKNALFILGTLAQNPGLEVSATPVQTEPGRQIKFKLNLAQGLAGTVAGALGSLPGVTTTTTTTIRITKTGNGVPGGTQQEVIRLSSDGSPANTADMTQQGKIAAAMMKAGITSPAAWAAAGISNPTAVVASSANGGAAAPGLAAEEFDLHPPTILTKGAHDPAFVISWRSQKQIVRSLGWKSAAMIWGGPAVTLVCVYILATHFGWL